MSPEKLKEIEEHAYDLLPWKDIAYLTGIAIKQFKSELDDINSEIHKAYHKGRVKRKKELRKPVLNLATKGAPQAELLAQKYIEEQELSETDE